MGFFTKKSGGEKSFKSSVNWLIVGLGNPGSQYENTRHNCGFKVIDEISKKYGVKPTRIKFKSLCGEVNISGQKCLVMKPTTYMNNSGQAVVEAMNFYKVPIENILVICDDISLAVGKLRVRRKGSDGGQKGLRSIIYLSGKDTFPRVKVGVGEKPNPEYDLADWVLSKFTSQEAPKMQKAFEDAVSAVELIISGDTDKAMNLYN